MRIALVAITLAAACLPTGDGYQCATGIQCDRGPDGACEANGFCSYSDDDCSNGRRYGSTAGSLSGRCVTPGAPPDSYFVGGTITGLTSSGLVLRANDTDDLPITADGAFTFATPLPNGEMYAVTVSTQPSGQTCRVVNGSGAIADAEVTNIIVTCDSCPGQYTPYGGSSYRFVTTPTDWLAAERACEADGPGAHLVVPDAVSETMTIDAISSASRTWVGDSARKTSGTWLWVTGGAGLSLGNDATNRCARYFDGTGGGTAALEGQDCAGTAAYLCECDTMPVAPASY